MPAQTIPARPSRSPTAAAQAVGVSGDHVRARASARTRTRQRRRTCAAAAQGASEAHRADRRHRLPGRQLDVPAVQACNDPAQWPFERVADAAAATAPDLVIHVGDYHYREGALPGAATPAARAARGATATTRGVPISSSRRASCSPRRRGSWCAAITNRAIARDRAGGASSIRGRSRRGRTATQAANDDIGNYSEPYAVPLGRDADTQFLVFDSSSVGVAPLDPADLMYRNYRARARRRVRAGARTPRDFFIEPSSRAGLRGESRQSAIAVPRQRGTAVGARSRCIGRALFPANVEALSRGPQSPARGRELRDAASAAVHHRQRRRLDRRAVSRAVSARSAATGAGRRRRGARLDARASAS